MASFFLILFLISFVALIVGFVSPGTALFWSKTKTRGRSALIYGVSAIILFIAFGIAQDASGELPKPEDDLSFKIAKKDSHERYIAFRVVIPKRYDKAKMIAIIQKLRQDREWEKKLTCFFDYKYYNPNSMAFAACAYLPECKTCATDKDAEGVPVQFNQILLPQSEVNAFKPMQYNKPGARILASYINYTAKVQIVQDGQKFFQVTLFKGGGQAINEMIKRTGWFFMKNPASGEEDIRYTVMPDQVQMSDGAKLLEVWPTEY